MLKKQCKISGFVIEHVCQLGKFHRVDGYFITNIIRLPESYLFPWMSIGISFPSGISYET